MRKGTFISVLVLLALLSGAGPWTVRAKEMPPVETLPSSDQELAPGLNGPVSEWTAVDLERLVDLIFDERITMSQSETIAKQLTTVQLEKIGELMAVKTDIPLDEWRQAVAESPENETISSSSTFLEGMLWGLWPIEYYNLQWGRLADYYYSSSECGSSDDDWVYYFYVYYAQNPDGLRWWTDSSKVYWTFLIFYGPIWAPELNGFAYWWDEARLCVGKTAASVAGGANYVKDHLYVRHH